MEIYVDITVMLTGHKTPNSYMLKDYVFKLNLAEKKRVEF